MNKLRNDKLAIIINADDFGYDLDSTLATIECLEIGAIRSASVMPNMPATQLAVNFAKKNPQFSFGIHLTFSKDTQECSISDPKLIKSICRRDGSFFKANIVRSLALLKILSVDQICIEMSSQIEKMLDEGLKISHIDSHGHLHKFKPFMEALKRVLPYYGISKVRNIQNVYINKPYLSPTYWFGQHMSKRLKKSFLTTPYFFMSTCENDIENITKVIDSYNGGLLEIGFHPGSINHRDVWRYKERLACLKLSEFCNNAGIQLINWNDINDF